MIASHLGSPGVAGTEPLASSLSDDGGAISCDAGTSVIPAAACFLDRSEPPPPPSVKQAAGGDGSVPVLPPLSWAVSPEQPEQPATVVIALPVHSALRRYNVDDNHDVRRFLDQYQTGYRRAIVERWLGRMGRYMPMLLDVFKQKGLPEELVFTAMVESGFDPLAVSRAGAKGLWQFMAPTARRYGLRIDNWLDERLDPEKSTVAAARHLMDLYAVFGSWNLAQAAYNAGERTVLEAIRAMGTSDFWTLARGTRLADETKNFVPAIQAATMIARNPERYGFAVTPAPPLAYELVSVPRSTNLKSLAARAGIDPDVLTRLNPELRLGLTPPDAPYNLKVPVEGMASVRMALEKESAPRFGFGSSPARDRHLFMPAGSPTARVGVHVVKRQETLTSIARRYNVTVADLLRWNDLDSTARIRPGARLRVIAQEAQASLR